MFHLRNKNHRAWALLSATALTLSAVSLSVFAAPVSRSVNVSGHGEISVEPNMADLSMAAQSTASSPDVAQKQTDRIVKSFMDKIASLKIKSSDLSTAAASVQPVYQYDAGKRTLTGYQASRGIHIVIHSLRLLPKVMHLATEAGITQISAPQLKSSHAPDLELKALAKAARNARSKAAVLAQTLGMRLGPVEQIDSQMPAPSPRLFMMKAMTAAPRSGSEQNNDFRFGEIKFEATVQTRFDLLAAKSPKSPAR